MKRPQYSLIASLLVLLISTPYACTQAQTADVSKDVWAESLPPVSSTVHAVVDVPVMQEDIFAQLSGIPASSVSFFAQAIDGYSPVMAFNSDLPQNPASTIKLVTAYAAFKSWGAEHRWQTRLWTQGTVTADGQLNSPLVIEGSGDPQLVIEKANEWVQQLKAHGIRQINAPIGVDRSRFALTEQNAAEFDGAPQMPYNALPDPALLNYHAVSFEFDPLMREVRMVPNLAGLHLNNQVRWVEAACPVAGWKAGLNVALNEYSANASGTYYSGCGTTQWHLHAHQMSHNHYAKGLLAGLFAGTSNMPTALGAQNTPSDMATINWTQPQVVDLQLPTERTGWQDLAVVTSEPLKNVLKDMNFYSNNVMARQVYLSLSASAQSTATLEASALKVQQHLQQSGIDTTGLNMVNGSGLARQTQTTAQQLGKVLMAAASMPDFVDTLPRIGMEGTVKRWLLNTSMVGRGRIKTGSLNDVRALAGYVDGVSGKRYAVVSIIHHPNAQSEAGRRAQNTFLQWVGGL